MDTINLALVERLPLIGQSLSAAFGNIYNQNNHPSHFSQVPGFTVVMWKAEIAVAPFLLGNFTNYYPPFFFLLTW